MNRRLTTALAILAAVIALSAIPVGAYGTDDSSTETPDTEPGYPAPVNGSITFYGYVSNLSDEEGNKPLAGVTVILYTQDGESSTTTDADGMFEFTMTYETGSDYYLRFEYSGYMVRSLPDQSMDLVENDYVKFEIHPDMQDEEGKYALTGPADGPHAIVMVITNGTIFGNVYRTDGSPVAGADVTVVSGNGQSYVAKTDGNGYFSVECPYGEYTMTVSCRGFTTTEPMTVSTDYGHAYSMTLNEYSSNLIFGLDSAHSMMAIGIVLALAFVVVFTLAIRKSRSETSSIILVNDLKDSEEEDVRRP